MTAARGLRNVHGRPARFRHCTGKTPFPAGLRVERGASDAQP